eukprot:TRINITY_DN378_c1_g1_i8.p1 TRINITY_DN378_c1_g1~~TRINITY_DN378_c1_g1_i8.p1  ORF type:complete len:440 (-),score=177.90 TRINITY_DN378_c1_g1_i8:562-1881(-)
MYTRMCETGTGNGVCVVPPDTRGAQIVPVDSSVYADDEEHKAQAAMEKGQASARSTRSSEPDSEPEAPADPMGALPTDKDVEGRAQGKRQFAQASRTKKGTGRVARSAKAGAAGAKGANGEKYTMPDFSEMDAEDFEHVVGRSRVPGEGMSAEAAARVIQRQWRTYWFWRSTRREMAAIKIQRFVRRARLTKHSSKRLEKLTKIARDRATQLIRSGSVSDPKMTIEQLARIEGQKMLQQEEQGMKQREQLISDKIKKAKKREARRAQELREAAAVIIQRCWRKRAAIRKAKAIAAGDIKEEPKEPATAEGEKAARLREIQDRVAGVGRQVQRDKLETTLKEWMRKEIKPSMGRFQELKARAAKEKSRRRNLERGQTGSSSSSLPASARSLASSRISESARSGAESARSGSESGSSTARSNSKAAGASQAEDEFSSDMVI